MINAAGTLSSLGGCRIRPEAQLAMRAVADTFIDYEELVQNAGAFVAKRLGVEAAVVVAGASAGLALAAAAAIAGKSSKARGALPSTYGPNEILIAASHRNPYDHALRIGGASLAEFGDAISPDTRALADSISPNTVAVAYFLQASLLDSSLSLEDTINVAHDYGVPVIVDAAAELPPKHHLWSLAEAGADLVVFSGGKHIGGPPASGLVVGKKGRIEEIRYQSLPNYGIGRPMKASKEAIVGLVAALEAYLDEDERELFDQWESMANRLEQALHAHSVTSFSPYVPTQPRVQPAITPRLSASLCSEDFARQVQAELKHGQPPIAVDRLRNRVILNVQTMLESDIEPLAERLSLVLGIAS